MLFTKAENPIALTRETAEVFFFKATSDIFDDISVIIVRKAIITSQSEGKGSLLNILRIFG